jgi:S-formylglutathione hydrolase FrmB
MANNVDFDAMGDAVEAAATSYEDALSVLQDQSTDSAGGAGTMSISQATRASTDVSIAQAVTDFSQGMAKNAADHVKKQGGKLSQ